MSATRRRPPRILAALLSLSTVGCALPLHTTMPEPSTRAKASVPIDANLVVVSDGDRSPDLQRPNSPFDRTRVGESLRSDSVRRKAFEAVTEALSATDLFSRGVLTSPDRAREGGLRRAMVDAAREEKADYSAVLEVTCEPPRSERNWLFPLAWVPGVVIGAQTWAPTYTVRSEVSLTMRFFSRVEARQTHTVTVIDQVNTLARDPLAISDAVLERTLRHSVPRLVAQILERSRMFSGHRESDPLDVATSRICLGSFEIAGCEATRVAGGGRAGDVDRDARSFRAGMGPPDSSSSPRLVAVRHAIPALLRGSLLRRGYTLAARRDLDEVLAELRIQRTEMFDREHLGEIGRLAGAELVVTGTILEVDDAVLLEIVGYDIETGLSAIGGSARIEPSDDLKTIADDLAARLFNTPRPLAAGRAPAAQTTRGPFSTEAVSAARGITESRERI